MGIRDSFAFIFFFFFYFLSSPQGVATPALYLVDLERRRIYMEYMDRTVVLKDFIDENLSGKPDVDHLLDFVGRGLGTLVARLHSKHIIHGDLTTSNILLKTDSNGSACSSEAEGKRSSIAEQSELRFLRMFVTFIVRVENARM